MEDSDEKLYQCMRCREVLRQRGGHDKGGWPRELSGFRLLLTISDAAHDKEEREEIENLFTAHMDRFIENYAITDGYAEKS